MEHLLHDSILSSSCTTHSTLFCSDDVIDPDNDKQPQFDLLNNKSKGRVILVLYRIIPFSLFLQNILLISLLFIGILVQRDLKSNDKPSAKKTPASKTRGSASTEKGGGGLGKWWR